MGPQFRPARSEGDEIIFTAVSFPRPDETFRGLVLRTVPSMEFFLNTSELPRRYEGFLTSMPQGPTGTGRRGPETYSSGLRAGPAHVVSIDFDPAVLAARMGTASEIAPPGAT